MTKKSEQSDTGDKTPSFEEALEKLEEIVHLLEEGEVGLAEAMDRYEEGVKLLSRCYKQLEAAERRIELLSRVDGEGRPVVEDFDEAEQELGEKAESRSRRRSKKKSRRKKGDVDESEGLF